MAPCDAKDRIRQLEVEVARLRAPLELTGHQVNLLHEFTDGDPDFPVHLQELPDRTACNGERMPAGLYAWSADYPEEGVLLLTAEPICLPQQNKETGNG